MDKSRLLAELFPLVEEGSSYICITRPRRFGKTVMANMLTAFFSRACQSDDIFHKLQISEMEGYHQHRNQYAVIHISFNDVVGECSSYSQYINRIEKRLIRDLKRAYPEVALEEEEYVVDVLTDIYEENENAKFIFVLDEWDYIFHQDFATEADKKKYLTFLRSLLKDCPYVRLAYMTEFSR